VGGDKLRKTQAHCTARSQSESESKANQKLQHARAASRGNGADGWWRMRGGGEHDTRSKSKQCSRGTLNSFIFFIWFLQRSPLGMHTAQLQFQLQRIAPTGKYEYWVLYTRLLPSCVGGRWCVNQSASAHRRYTICHIDLLTSGGFVRLLRCVFDFSYFVATAVRDCRALAQRPQKCRGSTLRKARKMRRHRKAQFTTLRGPSKLIRSTRKSYL